MLTAPVVQAATKGLLCRVPTLHVERRWMEIRSGRALNATLSCRSNLTDSREPAKFESSPEMFYLGNSG